MHAYDTASGVAVGRTVVLRVFNTDTDHHDIYSTVSLYQHAFPCHYSITEYTRIT